MTKRRRENEEEGERREGDGAKGDGRMRDRWVWKRWKASPRRKKNRSMAGWRASRRHKKKRAERRRRERKRGKRRRRERKRGEAQEAREKEARAQEEQAREERKAQEEREEEREVEAQEGHDGEEEVTTQEKCVEAKKEANSMHEESDVSKRHMTWWKNAWWIRMDSGPHMRAARGRRRIWRAARRGAEQARDNDGVGETQSFAEEAEEETGGRKKWEQGTARRLPLRKRNNPKQHDAFAVTHAKPVCDGQQGSVRRSPS